MSPKFSSIAPISNCASGASVGALDLHSHILPSIDDGSASAEESLEIMRALRAQGVTCVVATPHFYPERDRIDDFLYRRTRSAESLRSALVKAIDGGEVFPRVLVGAEVAYFKGISRSERVRELCIEGTELLLVEMPFSLWRESEIEELAELKARCGSTPVLAHVERYKSFRDADTLRALTYNGALIQCNADAFLRLSSRGRALRLLQKGTVSFLGSDSHGICNRPPKLGAALELIAKRLGEDEVMRLNDLWSEAVKDATPLL